MSVRRARRSQKCWVQISSEIHADIEWSRLSVAAQWAYAASLGHLARDGDPHGIYPHAELAREMQRPHPGRDTADTVADQLLAFGVWEFAGLGYTVKPYCGWMVRRESRAYIPVTVRRAVYARDGHRCIVCQSGESLSLDHIVPWSMNGSDEAENLQTMCRSCNSRKGALCR